MKNLPKMKKLTVEVDENDYNTVVQNWQVHGHLTKLLRKVFNDLAILIRSGKGGQVIQWMYNSKVITIGEKKGKR